MPNPLIRPHHHHIVLNELPFYSPNMKKHQRRVLIAAIAVSNLNVSKEEENFTLIFDVEVYLTCLMPSELNTSTDPSPR
uniref:Uncharacterized protein n=1 Tax=Panagrellus redivivus TaxID=6233 RepID=A0A7E4VA56_PANRE